MADTDHNKTLDLNEIKVLFDKLPNLFNKDKQLRRLIEKMETKGKKGSKKYLNKEEFMEFLEQVDQETDDNDDS
jgi:hypothetical protein